MGDFDLLVTLFMDNFELWVTLNYRRLLIMVEFRFGVTLNKVTLNYGCIEGRHWKPYIKYTETTCFRLFLRI